MLSFRFQPSAHQPAQTVLAFSAVILSLSVMSVLAAAPAQAQTLYNNRTTFDAATTTSVSFDFENIAPAGDSVDNPDLSPLTVSVQSADPNSHVASGSFANGAFSLNGSADLLAGLATNTRPLVIISFGSSITAFGTDIGFIDSTNGGLTSNAFFAQLYNGNTQVGDGFGSEDPALFNASRFSSGFFGVTSDTPFDSIHIGIENGSFNGDYLAYDNMSIGNVGSVVVPEPGSIALIGTGLGIAALPLAGLIRRRKAS